MPVIPAFWEAEVGESQPGPHGKKPISNRKTAKIRQADTCSPSYSEAEAGESLEPGRWRLQ